MDVREQLGENVARIRASQGLSQTQLASRLGARHMGIRQSYVSELERGMKNPTLTTLRAIAEALEVELKVLLDFK